PNQELVLVVAYAKDWPDTLGFRIVLAERAATTNDPPCAENFADAGAPKWDEDARVLTLFVAKGRIVRLRYASFVDKAFLGTLGLADWTNSPGEADFVRSMAQAGCGWMTTPYRSLVLVHATQQPVCLPEFLALVPQRSVGDQHATLAGRVRMHGPSTGKFEIEAAWHEWVDEPDKPRPERVESHGQLGEIQLSENHENMFGIDAAVDEQQPEGSGQKRARGDRHEFGDTKFRLIEYTMRATTRFREYLPEALYEQRDEVTRVGPIAEGPAMQVGADDDPGAPVLRTASGTQPHTVVLASAPPDDPRVVYTMPTFRWVETKGSGSLDSTRFGNGLRVWLERPWFTSGDGELLGVVILGENRPFTDVPAALVPLVTQWGLDPIWDTVLPKYRSRVEDFPARVADEPVPLQEFPSTTVHVVGHRVHWDDTRKQWYCDIELDPGRTYMPFARLALVRYQPNALPGAKISKVVLAEFAQVLPRRRSTFQRTGASVAFNLRGSVPDHGPMQFPIDSEYQDISFIPPFPQAGESGRNRVELLVQTRDPAVNSDLAWNDASVLASSLVPAQPPAPPSGPAVPPGGVVVATPRALGTAASIATGLGRRGVLENAVNVNTIAAAAQPPIAAADAAINVGVIGQLIDPIIWQSTVTVPETGGKPARLVVREYERYYTDLSVPEFRAGATRHRRVIEERLVYTAFFEL
ncbi:MAG: hypothetical protein ACM36C_11505, partial [Acidobacteriota bacterium]